MLRNDKYNCATGIIRRLWADNDLIIRTSTIQDWIIVDKLQKENSFAVGFIQQTIWEKYVWGGERNFTVLIAEKNLDPVGYILITPGKKSGDYAKIQQICVRNDARRLKYGQALLDVGKNYCEDTGKAGFTLRCRKDLDSNRFWGALNFEKYGVWEKGRINHVGFTASDDINLWKIDLNEKMPKLL
jgi:GNAT superfamily N-acetyltransferase